MASRNGPSSRRDFLRGRWFWGDDRATGSDVTASAPDAVLPEGPTPPCLRLDAPAANPCLDCDGPCVDVCEPRVIRRHGWDHSLRGRAYLHFERAGCTWCGDCLEVCPQTPSEDRRVTRVGQVLLDERACLPHQGVPCTACRTVCPEDALLFDERGRPKVEATACTGCGLCVAPCPTDAYRVVPVRAPH